MQLIWEVTDKYLLNADSLHDQPLYRRDGSFNPFWSTSIRNFTLSLFLFKISLSFSSIMAAKDAKQFSWYIFSGESR